MTDLLPTAVHGGDSVSDRQQRARALASFFAAGAAVSALAIVLPGWDDIHDAGIAVTVGMATAGALTLVTLASYIGRVACQVFTATGTLLIAACQVLAGGGEASAAYAMLYLWVVLHSALFFSAFAVAGQLSLIALAQVVAFIWLGDVGTMAPRLALTLGTAIVAAIVVGSLAQRLRRLADTDSLTGLGNRRVVDRALEWSLARSHRKAWQPTSLTILDLDGFKAFNDEHGHLAGDRLLVEAGAAWRKVLRRTDILARTGGDEFMAILADCDLGEAERIAHRLALHTPEGVTCSAGVACWDGHESASELIDRADAALYAAKLDGPVAVAGASDHGDTAAAALNDAGEHAAT